MAVSPTSVYSLVLSVHAVALYGVGLDRHERPVRAMRAIRSHQPPDYRSPRRQCWMIACCTGNRTALKS